jgi:hypothetical protein
VRRVIGGVENRTYRYYMSVDSGARSVSRNNVFLALRLEVFFQKG